MDIDQNVLAALGGFILVISIVSIIFSVIMIIAKWKVFTKGGEEGWKSIIPIYNLYTMYKIIGVNPIWILVVYALAFLSAKVQFLSIVYFIAALYTRVLYCISLSKAFGKDTGFGICTFFFEPICLLILGFGSSEFIGKNPMEDPILGLFDKSSGNTNTTTNNQAFTQEANVVNETAAPQQNATGFCTNCGSPLTPGSAFCTKCGNKIN